MRGGEEGERRARGRGKVIKDEEEWGGKGS